VPRDEWGAYEELNREPVSYTGAARVVFVHHTDHPDDYACAEVPALLRQMHVDQVGRRGWDDLGYNFVVDKCGTIYEGRTGGIGRSVFGAHTQGFNTDTVGVAALGRFEPGATVAQAQLDGIARVAGWKLRPGTDPRDLVELTSTSDASRYPEGVSAEFDAISGHRDGSFTHCPGEALYELLPTIRERAAQLRMSRP
jgi:hypothetical protein